MANPDIRTKVWRNGVVECENFPFEEVSDYLEQPDTLVWADLLWHDAITPDDDTLATLADELGLDPLAVEDAHQETERPKAKRYPSHVFVTAYSLRDTDGGALGVGRFSVFLTPRGFVTIRLDDSIDMDAVRQRWDDGMLKHGSLGLLYGLLDVVVDQFDDEVQRLDARIQDIEDSLFDEDNPPNGRTVSQDTFALRRALTVARRAVLPMREVVQNVMRGLTGRPDAVEVMPYYEDLFDHVLRASEQTESLRDTITSIFQANMQVADHNMNVIMKQLTAWAAIIAVPTAVTGYFGQNVPYPGFSQVWGFWSSAAVIVVLAVILYVSFKKRGWL